MNQRLNPLKCGTGSNLVDVGRAAVRVELICGETTPKPVIYVGGEAIGESLRRTRGEAAGAELGAHPIDRHMVNVGTVPESPSPTGSQLVGGQARCQLMAPGRGGGSVVVRGRESRLHGEGTQRVSNAVAGMPGGRR